MEHAATTEFVTYRELVSMLDNRDARLIAEHHDLNRRMEHLDDHGSRGLQRVSDRLDQAVKELARHNDEHRTLTNNGINNKQWTLTTLIALAGALIAVWDKLPN